MSGLVKVVGRNLIPLGKRKITRMTRAGKEKYLVYLPESNNELWRVLHEKKVAVAIYIEIPEEEKLGE